ncbi:hypothetical protein SADUNF_Sadunf17G0104100 [Salix dunnii]|uniref:Secreted protein n=1 Tax=Salix dunnii TaxID=1413687 RepID=A0A835J8F6_9ROSI|nr:hypothetical protein SADUNF_Sadunf17G0104100 [Salix dunnii]
MKVFLIICILIATAVFYSLSTSTARELSHQGPDRTLDTSKPPRDPVKPPPGSLLVAPSSHHVTPSSHLVAS